MSQIKNISLLSISILVLIAIFGCGTANKNNVYDPATGHEDNWDHGSAYLSNTGSCTTCHGSDLMGGTSKVSCYSDSYNGQSCHATGPGGHPSGWALPENHGLRQRQILVPVRHATAHHTQVARQGYLAIPVIMDRA